jgi:hypothetical protein
MAFDVFISHSSGDKQAADATCAALEAAAIRCWIAPRDVRAGREYAEEIITAIDSCRVMVLIFSSSANASNQVRREIERAVSKGVTIVTMRIEDVLPSKSMEFYLDSLHWLDALTPPLAKHLEYLVEQVSANLRVDEVSGISTSATQSPGKVATKNIFEKGWAGKVAFSNFRKWHLIAGVVALLVLLSVFGWANLRNAGKPASATQLDGIYVGKFTSSLIPDGPIQSAIKFIQTGKTVALTFETYEGVYGTGSGTMSSNEEGQFTLQVNFVDQCTASYTGKILVIGGSISSHITGQNCTFPKNPEEIIDGLLTRSPVGQEIFEAFRRYSEARNYKRQGNIDDALLAFTDSNLMLKRLLAKDPDNSMWQQDIEVCAASVDTLGTAFVLMHDFRRALDTADLAISMTPDMLWIYADRAIALMFLNRIDEARSLFLKYADRRDADGDASWQTFVIDRFSHLRDAGLTNPLMDEIEKRFGRG